MPQEIADLSQKILRSPERVEVAPQSSTVDAIEQTLYKVDKVNKKYLLAHVLEDKSLDSVLVFTNTKHGADRVVTELGRVGVAAMAFSTHRQVEIQPGDRVIISASAIPGNEKAIGRIINELYRKGADVVCDKLSEVHVSGHACQEEIKIIHGLLKPRFFIPIHGEQRHLRTHAKLAVSMVISTPFL